MPDAKNPKQKLQDAIADEKIVQRQSRLIYEALTARMEAYQLGKGPAPSNEEFAQWREAVEQRVEIRQMAIAVDGEPR